MLGLLSEKRDYTSNDLQELASKYHQEQRRTQGLDDEGV